MVQPASSWIWTRFHCEFLRQFHNHERKLTLSITRSVHFRPPGKSTLCAFVWKQPGVSSCWLAQAFRKVYPAVDLQINKMVTDEGRLFCGGGITADLNLSLYLISKYCGREVALQRSRCTLVDLDRITQLPFAIFLSDKNHQDPEILNAQEWIENNYRQNISVDSLAEAGGMSKRNFNRRFKSATGESVVSYIQLIRVEAAKKLLEQGSLSFDDVSVDIGYENVSFFRRIFKRTTGLSPTAYRKKFNLFL